MKKQGLREKETWYCSFCRKRGILEEGQGDVEALRSHKGVSPHCYVSHVNILSKVEKPPSELMNYKEVGN